MSEPREYTVEECRKLFMDHIRGIIQYWQHETRCTKDEAISGVAFSILVMIDGESEFPALKLLTDPHPTDKQYYQKHGENWYPVNADITKDVHLHDLLHTDHS